MFLFKNKSLMIYIYFQEEIRLCNAAKKACLNIMTLSHVHNYNLVARTFHKLA